MKKIGLIINPVAGMGGRVGLKGSDGKQILKRALELGAYPVSPGRTRITLNNLARLKDEIDLFTYPGEMGEEVARACGFIPKVLGSIKPGKTGPEDTMAAAHRLAKEGLDLLVFTGGDGTARNLYDVVSDTLPILGIPGGVKIHSGVFATSPVTAARLVMDFIRYPGKISMRAAEVMDIDEKMIRKDQVSARLYGYMNVPYERGLTQSSKAGSNPKEEIHQDGIALDVIHNMAPDTLYLMAPGTTVKAITDKLGVKGTLLGIDALWNKKIVDLDLNEGSILDILKQEPGVRVKIIVTIIGRQGYLFGRGNQQFSPSVLQKIGKENILVVATSNKILSLKGAPFLVDTGDTTLDKTLEGYARVITEFGRRQVYPILSCSETYE